MRRSPLLANSSVATPAIASMMALASAGSALFWLTRSSPSSPASEARLVVYCAAAAAPAIEPILDKFQAEHSVRTRLQVGSSGALETQLRLSGVGDLFIPAATDPFLNRLRQEGRVTRAVPVARLQLVVAFRREHPIEAGSLRELINSGAALGLCNEQAAAGQRTRQVLEGAGMWEDVSSSATASMMTVTELAGAIRDGGRLQAGVVWNTTARQFGLETIEPPELAGATASIGAGVLSSSRDAELAERLARYLAAPEGGRPLLLERGYRTEPSP